MSSAAAAHIVSTLADLLGLRSDDNRGLADRVIEELGRSRRLLINSEAEAPSGATGLLAGAIVATLEATSR